MKTQYEEVNEAIIAGREVLANIEYIEKNLRSAKGWGFIDLFSDGGFLTSIIKHSKLNNAENAMQDLRYSINKFNSELSDIHISESVGRISMGTGMQLADWFLDGLLIDAITLSHIGSSQREIAGLKDQVLRALEKLRVLRSAIEEQGENK